MSSVGTSLGKVVSVAEGRARSSRQDTIQSVTRLALYAWTVLAYNLGVILWGAYVRATGSGAGCGSHWPLCDGQLVPTTPSVAMLIEYSHRVTSGLALISVVVLLWWTRRERPAGHAARRAAGWTVVFMLLEAAVGAGLVLFELVADNATMARALFMAVHLANTFVLVAWLTLTAWWLSDGPVPSLRAAPSRTAMAALLAAGLMLVGISGAVAALGDTLFPARSLGEALAADLSATSHLLIRLRIWHPALAIAVAVVLAAAAPWLSTTYAAGRLRGLGRLVAGLALTQLAVGFINVLLLAPVAMQLVHLLVADLLWIAFVLHATSVLPARRLAGSEAVAAPATGPAVPADGPVRAR